ncbi:MAG: hypothetical protein U0670_02250 [Anaerolineae bacterium]
MPFKVGWLIPARVVFVYSHGEITMDDYQYVTPIGAKYVDEGEAPVHTFTDSRDVKSMPRKVQEVIAMMRSMGSSSEKAGWIIHITPNSLHRFGGALVAQWFVKSGRFHAVTSPREGLMFLKERDSRLSDMDVDAVEAAYEAQRSAIRETSGTTLS